MPHLSPRILLLISLFYLSACGESALVQPDLISAKFQGADKKIDDLNILDSTSLTAAALPSDTSGLKIIETSGSIFLGFSEFLNGDMIEEVNRDSKNKTVQNFTAVPGTLEIACRGPSDTDFKACPSTTVFSISYRPDGGYVPLPDTPVSNFPPPAVRLSVASDKPMPNNTVIVVYVVAGPIKNTKNTPMAEVGKNPVTGNPVAAAAWFKTKLFGIMGTTYDSDSNKVTIQFNGQLTTIDPKNFLLAGSPADTAEFDPKSNNTAVILTFKSLSASSSDKTYDITVKDLGITSTQFVVPGKN